MDRSSIDCFDLVRIFQVKLFFGKKKEKKKEME